MEHDIDKFTDRLSNLQSEPNGELFEKIYNKYNDKRKRRLFFWLFPSLVGLGAVGVFWFFNSGPIIDNTKLEPKIIQKSVETQKTKDTIIDTCYNKATVLFSPKESNSKENNLVKSNQDLNLKSTRKNEFDIYKTPNLSTKTDEISYEKSLQTEASSVSPNFINSAQNEVQENVSQDEFLDSNVENSEGKQSLTLPSEVDLEEISTMDKKALFAEMLLLPYPEMYLCYDRKIKIPDVIPSNQIKPVQNLRRFMVDVYGRAGNQQFCSFADATKSSYGMSMSHKMYKNLNLRLGISQSAIRYSYDFTDVLFDRFGHTDKFPVLSLMSSDVQNISNVLNYNSLDIGLSLVILNQKRHQLRINLDQELVFYSEQLFDYKLVQIDHYKYQITSRKITIHQIIPSVSYYYKIYKNIGVGGLISYNYSLRYLGMERERYSGFNFGGNLTYGF